MAVFPHRPHLFTLARKDARASKKDKEKKNAIQDSGTSNMAGRASLIRRSGGTTDGLAGNGKKEDVEREEGDIGVVRLAPRLTMRGKLPAPWTNQTTVFRHVITSLPIPARIERHQMRKERQLIGSRRARSYNRTASLGVDRVWDGAGREKGWQILMGEKEGGGIITAREPACPFHLIQSVRRGSWKLNRGWRDGEVEEHHAFHYQRK